MTPVRPRLKAAFGVAVLLWLAGGKPLIPATQADGWPSAYGRDGGAPPADVTYSFGSAIHEGARTLGSLDSLNLHVGYLGTLRQSDTFEWLAGVDWKRFQFGVPDDSVVPDLLQSTALVLGAKWRFADRWQARLEALPGVYSDFADVGGDSFNTPFSLEVTYAHSDTLTLGGQLLVDARRRSPVLGGAGVTWRFAEDWRLVFWLPRPQLEWRVADRLTLFAGASFTGGTFVVAEDFGTRRGRAALDGQAVDFQEVRAGAGFRWLAAGRYNAELAGGWTIDRRFHFHGPGLLLNGDGAPYVQASVGLNF